MAKLTAVQIKEQVKRIAVVVEKARKENKLAHFVGVTPEVAAKKLARVDSPMIVFEAWSDSVPGGTLPFFVGVYNPDPTPYTGIFAHVFVGSGNVDPTVGTFLLNADGRWPRLTEPGFVGLGLAPNASGTLSFTLAVPAAAEKTHYLGNCCVMQTNFLDAGTYLDRGVFVFSIA